MNWKIFWLLDIQNSIDLLAQLDWIGFSYENLKRLTKNNISNHGIRSLGALSLCVGWLVYLPGFTHDLDEEIASWIVRDKSGENVETKDKKI